MKRRRHREPGEPLGEWLAILEVRGTFPFRDNPRLAPFLNDVGLFCDGVSYWQHELGMDALDQLDRLASPLNGVLSILHDDANKERGFVETNILRLSAALRRAGHDDVGERLGQLIEDLKIIGATAPNAHYARPRGPNNAPSLNVLVGWLADFWERETKSPFSAGNWKPETGSRFQIGWDSGAPNLPMLFAVEVVREFAPAASISRLSTVTRKIAKLRKEKIVSE